MSEEKNTVIDSTKLQWHPAFLQAIQMELYDYRDSLEFKYEYQLTSEPLRIDVLIVKKPKQLTIDKNIARIFKTDNLLEYKSPDDYVSVQDFLKVYAYANLYVAITPGVDLSEVTLTFIESRHPRKLIEYLQETRHYKVEETAAGIYEVSGDYLPIQIIESKRLKEDENLWLRSLRNDLEARTMSAILEKKKHEFHEMYPGAYFEVLLRANPETFMEVYKMEIAAFEEIFAKAGIIPQWIEQGREEARKEAREEKREIARNALAEGATLEFVHKITGLDMETLKNLSSK